MHQLALMPTDDWDKPNPALLPPPHGRVVSGNLTFIQAAPHPADPPGVIRWIVQQPDGKRIPRNATPADELDARHLHAVPDPEE